MNNKFLFFSFVLLLLSLPISVSADEEINDDSFSEIQIQEAIETSSNITDVPDINARHSVVIDRKSKQILYGKKETEKCKMASTTKIMTAIVVLENSNLSDIVTISKKSANIGGSRLGLSTNDKITVENLLYGLLLCSGNDAAVALAEHVGGSVEGFADLMNKKVLELNLCATNFVTPHGLDNDDHYTNAYELAIITDYALQNQIFKKIVGTKNYTIILNGYPKNISNTNELLGNLSGVYGVKTGFTNGANRCLVTCCKRADLDIICVVLGCDTKKFRTQDSIKLINYIFNNYLVVNIENIIDNNFNTWKMLHTNSFTVNKGIYQILDMNLNKKSLPYSFMAIKKSDLDNISTNITINSYLKAPIFTNDIIGNLSFSINNTSYFTINIVSSLDVPKKNTFFYFFHIFCNYSNYFKSGI